MEREGGPARPAALAALLLVATLGSCLLAVAIDDQAQLSAAWWPAAGVGVLALLSVPERAWLLVVPLLAAVFVVPGLVEDRPTGASVYVAVAEVLGAVLVALLVRRRIGRQMRSVTDVGWLLGITLAGALVAGLGIAVTSATELDGSFADTLGAAASAHWASVVLLAPLGLLPPRRGRLPLQLLGVQLALLVGATLVAFGPAQNLTLGFAPLPFLIWAGVSFGFRVVAFEQLAIGVLVTAMTLLDGGPFRDTAENSGQLAQLYLICLALTGLPLALAVRQQKLATAAARLAMQRTEAVVDSSTTPILVTDETGTILAANPATTSLTGFTAEDLVGTPFWTKLLPPESWEPVQRRFTGPDTVPENGGGVINTASGGERIVTYATGVIRNPVRGAYNLVITITDVTAERATTHLLQHLLRSATTVAIVTTDHAGTVTLVNAGAEAMLRIDPGTGTGRRFLDFLAPEEVAGRLQRYGGRDGFTALVADVAAEGVPQTGEWTWVAPNGFLVRVEMTTSVVADEAGRPIGYLFVARDVTETRRNQELLQRALDREETVTGHRRALDHAKDDFVTTVSHELRTPLTSIIGSTELLDDGLAGELNPEQKQLMEVIDRNAERLLGLANDLLLLAQHGNEGAAGDFGPVDLREVLKASFASIAPLVAQRDLEVRPGAAVEPVLVNGDAGYLERAVTNLLTNAIKFTPDGGLISTETARDPETGECYLAVTDSGIGIPADELESVFVRFFRSRNVLADAIQGTGLGLAIVRSIVESHQGRIDVASEPGLGTTFRITLPSA